MEEKIENLLQSQHGNFIFPFFWQHGEDEKTLREYMKVIAESNVSAVCVESRSHPDFCGEKWWEDMDIILDEARKRKMQVWILDDSHFPTGYANGGLEDKPDEMCRQSICCRIYETKEGHMHIGKEEILHPQAFQKSMIENYTMEKVPRQFDDDRLIAIYAARQKEDGIVEVQCRIDLKPFIKENGLDWEAPEGKWKIYVLHLSRNQGYHRSYINMMNYDSCRVLLDEVYEKHYQHYKEDFGTTIAGFFSDEPELGNGHMYEMDDPFGTMNDYPWSAELEKELEKSLGDAYPSLLALLWETGADQELTARVRYAYMNAVTMLVKDDFSMQIGSWCRQHGVQYIGHLIEDDNHHSRTGSSLGHYFRGLLGQDMAGIDDIGGQVFPQGEDISYNRGVLQHRNGEFYHYMLGKLASSAAAIEPWKHGNSVCEIFGNYGWSEGVRLEKYLADHFLVRGINHFVPHAFSAKEFPDADCPPHFYAHGNNPQYRHFGYLMRYMNRVCELISGGRHISPVAVLYHGEGDWTGNHMTSEKIGHVLADAQIEYDIIPQDVFREKETYGVSISKKRLKVNSQDYKVLLVPFMQYVTVDLARAILELSGENIPVIFVGERPQGICTGNTEDAAKMDNCNKAEMISKICGATEQRGLEDIVPRLRDIEVPEIEIYPPSDRIRYLHYVHEDCTEIYLFVNEGNSIYKGRVSFFGQQDGKMVYLYDAWENCIHSASVEDQMFQIEIEPLKSCILVLDSHATRENIKKMEVKNFEEKTKKEEINFCKKWRRSFCESINYPEFEKGREIEIPDHLAEEETEFSGFVCYENSFIADNEASIWLEITDAHEGVEVFVNEMSLGIQIVPIYRFNLSSAVIKGVNTIRIEVATTLERQMAKYPDRTGHKRAAKALSGITGQVHLWKLES